MLLNLKNKHIILNKRHYIYKKQLVIRKKITLKKAGNAHNYCSPALLSYQYLFFIYVYIYIKFIIYIHIFMSHFIYTYYNKYSIILKITYIVKIKCRFRKYALISLK